MRVYEYTQSSPSGIYKRIPQCEEDYMRICCPYTDELEYSATMGVVEALDSGLTERKDIIMYVMRKYRGHMNPQFVVEATAKALECL